MRAIQLRARNILRSLRAIPDTLARTSRTLRRAPGFVAIATISLGTALGLSTAVFALVDAMTHPQSPFSHVEQLYSLWIYGKAPVMPSPNDVRDALAALPAIEGIATSTFALPDVEAGESISKVSVAYVGLDFFNVVDAHPRLGRLPTTDENGTERVAVVSDEFWKLRFGNSRDIRGAHFSVDDHPYAIVGVLPPRAYAPQEITSIWIPQQEPPGARLGNGTVLTTSDIVRLRPGVSERDFVAQMKQITDRLSKTYVTGPQDRRFGALVHNVRPNPLKLDDSHRAMIGAAICILLIACANVAALMLARGTVRRRDYALRLALGASRHDIGREVLFEVGALATAGAIVGALVATWAVALMKRATPAEMSFMGFVEPQWSVRVLALTAVAVVVAVVISGGIPAWQASRTDPAGALKESSGGTTSRAGSRFRWLVMAELAVAMTLLVSTSLMLKSAVLMSRFDFGFDPTRLFHVSLAVNNRVEKKTAGEVTEIYRQSLARMRNVPGVESAAMISSCPGLWSVVTTDRTIEGARAPARPGCANVSNDYFQTLSRTIVQGRDFSEGDALGSGAVILDEKTAGHFFPHEPAVGRMVKLGNLNSKAPWMSVVGVVHDLGQSFGMYPEMGPDTSNVMFVSAPDSTVQLHRFVVKTVAGATGVRVAVGRAMRDQLPLQSSVTVSPWASDFNKAVDEERFLTLVFSLLGVSSLVLGAAGLFSVISYIASQRMREFAVRIALGASRENVVQLVLRDGFVMALGGTGVGAGFGMWAGFMLWDKMWGVYPVDVTALVSAEVTLLVVTMLACLAPAVRAMRADPVEVMRAI